ncbi:MAG: hypothetical protein J0L63_09850 [Anaerolineae bacterium]|nr:hypothetical protein [Anaerolineae bacterium]MBN8619198.1 hypothetical protein [Anaerolineae bacterium]
MPKQNNPDRKRRTGTETGLIPRVDLEPSQHHEPPQPRSLPEFADPSSITGIVPIASEGTDNAPKDEDDHEAATPPS